MKMHNSTLIYLENAQGEYLMLHRVKKAVDVNKDKWIGVGGKFEEGESPDECALREVREETGLTIMAPRLCGLKQFPLDNGGRYIVMLYRADRFSGELTSSEEGRVFWMKREDLERARLPVSFAETLQVFEDETLGEHYCRWEDGVFKRNVL